MSRITKDEWQVIKSAVAYFETVLFDDEQWECDYPKENEESARDKFAQLKKKVWSKTNGN